MSVPRARQGSGGGSLATLRAQNQHRVVDALRQLGSASRTEIARTTGLSRTTVASVVGDLQASGLVVGDANPAEVGSRRGRPATRLRLDPSAGVAVGVDFGHSHVRVAVADLASTVLAERQVPCDVDHARGLALDAAAGMVRDALAEAGVDDSRVIGIGMGVPGPVDRSSGLVGSSSILADWTGVSAGEELAERLGMSVEVDNDANLGALAELAFGAGRGVSDLVYVKISSGIGAGIVLGARLHRGATGFAGELGHVQVEQYGAVCRCGNRGCLETIASVPRLLETLGPAHTGEVDARRLFDLLEAGDPGARRVVNDAGREVGRVLAVVSNVLNPARIVVGGEIARAGEELLAGIRDALDRDAQPGIAAHLDVVAGVLGDRAEVLGAVALVVGASQRPPSTALPAGWQ